VHPAWSEAQRTRQLLHHKRFPPAYCKQVWSYARDVLTPSIELPARYLRPDIDRYSRPTQDRHPLSPSLRWKIFPSMRRCLVWLDGRSVLAKSYQFFFLGIRPSKRYKCSGKISVLDKHLGSDFVSQCPMLIKLVTRTDRVRTRRCIHWQSGRAFRSFRAWRQIPILGEDLWLNLTRIYPQRPDIREIQWAKTGSQD